MSTQNDQQDESLTRQERNQAGYSWLAVIFSPAMVYHYNLLCVLYLPYTLKHFLKTDNLNQKETDRTKTTENKKICKYQNRKELLWSMNFFFCS